MRMGNYIRADNKINGAVGVHQPGGCGTAGERLSMAPGVTVESSGIGPRTSRIGSGRTKGWKGMSSTGMMVLPAIYDLVAASGSGRLFDGPPLPRAHPTLTCSIHC